jgi:predicted ATPase
VELAGEKGSPIWKSYGAMRQGWLAAMTNSAAGAVQIITSAMDAGRSAGSTLWAPVNLTHLASAYAALGEFDAAWRCIGEAMNAMATSKETWWAAEVNRSAGEIALKPPQPDAAKAEAYFERALAVARKQQAKSWELRASMSLARLWRDQSKVQQARELLAPVYGWFTEGFDTRDLKEAKALLEELA